MTDRAITSGLIEHPDQLKEHIAELEQQLAECQAWSEAGYRALETQTKALAECQVREAKLREALKTASDIIGHPEDGFSIYLANMLALPQDDTALKEAIKRAIEAGHEADHPPLADWWAGKKEKHYPEEWGPSDNRRLTCVCGDPDPFHGSKTPNA